MQARNRIRRHSQLHRGVDWAVHLNIAYDDSACKRELGRILQPMCVEAYDRDRQARSLSGSIGRDTDQRSVVGADLECLRTGCGKLTACHQRDSAITHRRGVADGDVRLRIGRVGNREVVNCDAVAEIGVGYAWHEIRAYGRQCDV